MPVGGGAVTIEALYAQRCQEPSDIVDHLAYLHDTVCRYVEPVVVELGTRSGVSTVALLAAVEKVGGRLICVDVRQPRLPPEVERHPDVTVIVGDDLAIVDDIPACEVLFIDTSHHYAHTKAELAAYMPKCVGTALFHDTSLERPEGAPVDDPPFPVARALDEWCEAHQCQWTNRDWNNGLGTIEVAK